MRKTVGTTLARMWSGWSLIHANGGAKWGGHFGNHWQNLPQLSVHAHGTGSCPPAIHPAETCAVITEGGLRECTELSVPGPNWKHPRPMAEDREQVVQRTPDSSWDVSTPTWMDLTDVLLGKGG